MSCFLILSCGDCVALVGLSHRDRSTADAVVFVTLSVAGLWTANEPGMVWLDIDHMKNKIAGHKLCTEVTAACSNAILVLAQDTCSKLTVACTDRMLLHDGPQRLAACVR